MSHVAGWLLGTTGDKTVPVYSLAWPWCAWSSCSFPAVPTSCSQHEPSWCRSNGCSLQVSINMFMVGRQIPGSEPPFQPAGEQETDIIPC